MTGEEITSEHKMVMRLVVAVEAHAKAHQEIALALNNANSNQVSMTRDVVKALDNISRRV